MPSSRRRIVWTVVAVLAGMLVCMLLASQYALHRSLQEESRTVERQLSLYAQELSQRIDRYRTLPEVLALDPQLRAALTHPLTSAEVDQLNRKLEAANGASHSSTLTLINVRGRALAASNWRDERSNVGEDYSYRPYVTQAIAEGRGRFYGIGMTTGEAGYFLSRAIVDDESNIVGLIAIKILLIELERGWLQTSDIVFASDAHDVVFLANHDDWRYRLLAPLSPKDQGELNATRQYADQELRPLQFSIEKEVADGGTLARFKEPSLSQPMLWQTVQLPDSKWHLHLLHNTQSSTIASRWAAVAAAGIWLALAMLVLYVRQRQRLSNLRQRSRQELETVLHQHAQELRTAQDGILQAAKQADTGLSRSLQHLPQGVVVIDADLNLVAWNSRYVQLFRFPPELMRVGAPVEALIRHNARRGLIGPNPSEEAIQRRLDHLREGTSHLHESAKSDGTVLEIRGNPMPDGGFVTSYADITSYKNAARELRSLADTLEQRIAERTRDLDQAKREAESANRYKTRFVAAAVHDLLQPLNAARMFSSLLRSHLHDDTARHVADSIDGALTAQDGILNSLLDISRMESGQLDVHVRDFTLGPLLQVMQHNFGIIAESRGLKLTAVGSRYVVHSDEALLRRILQNLLSNAIRYTPKGRVLIGCRRRGDHLRIEVHDQGPGIPKSLQREIFEEFRRLNEGHDQDRGAGLGLAIVERLGKLLGHEIGLVSELGRGSTFWVSVPLAAQQPHQADATAAAKQPEARADMPLQGLRAWYIDDDAPSCAATGALLERWGCEVPFAGGPQAALDFANRGHAPQLVLLDVRMGAYFGPDLYGELSAIWQQSPQVILVTAERDVALRRNAAERGWAMLFKPVRPAALRALLSQTLLRLGEITEKS
ncbi:response regulator [Diaphorobacter sp. HDW4A]|uniref:hybrid sensor histidine kinase/response regulator n=1 Tax=Diaphorobacter sp. HDW4A TaxID=2714924 RepID=UPI00140E1382|nr:PAS-domain containing protein [Diaphorobacter sp. HDW4A]QIL82595.1 response regulator [Diaphorobacter sp. HDW4A]